MRVRVKVTCIALSSLPNKTASAECSGTAPGEGGGGGANRKYMCKTNELILKTDTLATCMHATPNYYTNPLHLIPLIPFTSASAYTG